MREAAAHFRELRSRDTSNRPEDGRHAFVLVAPGPPEGGTQAEWTDRRVCSGAPSASTAGGTSAAAVQIDLRPDFGDEDRPQPHRCFRVVAAVAQAPADALDLVDLEPAAPLDLIRAQ